MSSKGTVAAIINRRAQVLMDRLEGRLLCSTVIVAGQLRITGTSKDDVITVSLKAGDPSKIETKIRKTVSMFDVAGISSIWLNAGAGNDRVTISQANGAIKLNTTIYGGLGNDSIVGGAGRDRIYGGSGDDTISGGAGSDIIYGEAGDDLLQGDAGNDRLFGGDGSDTLIGGKGTDTLSGDAGTDYGRLDPGEDQSGVERLLTSVGAAVFRDDFTTPTGNMPDSAKWVVNHPDSSWWVQGRTFMPSPTLHPAGPFPRIENGSCVIEQQDYNPYDLGKPKTTFLGGEIHTVRQFDATHAYRFEASVRSTGLPNGLVTSFFLYGYDGAKSDEIDFEFLSKQTNDKVKYPNGDPILATTWNESLQSPQYATPTGLDLSVWNTFRIYWYPAQHRVEWVWVDAQQRERWLRTATDVNFVPDEPMNLYFNVWAPTDQWPDAYDSSLKPAQDLAHNRTVKYEIDYAEVRTLA